MLSTDTALQEAESAVSNNAHYRAITDIHPEMFQTSETLAGSAVNAAFTRSLKAIIVFSMTGRTARLAAKYRPSCPIICVTTDPITARQSCVRRLYHHAALAILLKQVLSFD